MKLFLKKTLTLALIAAGSHATNALAGEAELLEPLRPYVRQVVAEFGQIAPARADTLKEAAAYIRERLDHGKPVQLTFICTHNSRRSHLAQLWAQSATVYYNLTNVTAFSGGTEVTACNIRTVRALRRAGYSIVDSTGGTNPVYLAQFAEAQPPLKMFSKVYTAGGNPQHDYAALFNCDQADASCPIVQGADERFSVSYVDPKAADNTPLESVTYDERCRQIAREMFYLLSQVRKGS